MFPCLLCVDIYIIITLFNRSFNYFFVFVNSKNHYNKARNLFVSLPIFNLLFLYMINRSGYQFSYTIYYLSVCWIDLSIGDQTVTFSQVVIEVMRQLEGAYALIFKSPHYPNELIACKRGSILLLGVKVSVYFICITWLNLDLLL